MVREVLRQIDYTLTIVIDALDECDPERRKDLFENLDINFLSVLKHSKNLCVELGVINIWFYLCDRTTAIFKHL